MNGAEIALALLAGWLLADFLSGLLHWLEDRVLWQSMPILGKHVVVPNRLHHLDPVAFTRTGMWERNSTTWIPAAILAAIWFWLAGFSFVWLGALAGGVTVTEIHARNHSPDCRRPLWFFALQAIGIVQSRGEHSRHHRGEMNSNYCVLTDWLNPVLDRLGVWSTLERGLSAIGIDRSR
jgi:ubiquitin-conjugating enzyme E2 variant